MRILWAALIVAFSLGQTPAAGQATAETERRPNVILIMADDIGTECFASYGGASYSTPHLDALAAGGIRFTNCHSQPLCTPSRVKLMTGRSNIRNYSGFSILERDEATIGELMKAAGYATCVAGKWQLLGAENYGERAGTGTHPRDAGFDAYCLWQVSKLGSRYWGPLVDRDDELIQFDEDRYGPDVFCDYICDFIEAKRESPFFVYYPMALVHNPFPPTPDSADRTAKNDKRHFGDMVAYMDKIVGRIVASVESAGLLEHTLVIFTTDNGTNRSITSETSAGPVGGGKGRTTDAGTHVPLIASCPTAIPAGVVCADLIDFSDIVPTLAEACGFSLPTDRTIDGRSFFPQLRGEAGSPREWIYCYYNPRPGRKGFPERQFVRDSRWKLYSDGRLFDVAADRLEERPILAGEGNEAAEAALARARLHAARQTMPEKPALISDE